MIAAIPFPEYRPDQSAASGVLSRADNVFPALDGYRPVYGLVTQSDALTGTFLGAYSAIESDGTGYLLAGTSGGVYSMQADGTWTGLATGLSITNRWRFAQFGDFVVSVNGSATREIDLASGTANAIAGAPTGNSVAVVGDHVVIGRANGDISMVRWSAFADHTGWTNGTDQAGEQPMRTGGSVMGIAGGEYGVILQRERLVRMTRTGDAEAPFQFDEISSNFGCSSSASIAQAGRSMFFLSDRGFMALEDGQALKPIGTEKVDRTFIREIDRDGQEQLYTAVDPQNKLVMWALPGRPGLVWIYNFELDRWTRASFTFNGVFPGFTASTSLEVLAATYTDLDAMTISLDDPRWSGGNPSLYAVNGDNELCTFSGDTLAVQLDMGFFELAKGRRARLRGIRPVTDATSGITITVDARQRLGDGANETVADTLRSTGLMPIRCAGRYMDASFQIAAGANWNFVQALELEFEAGGER